MTSTPAAAPPSGTPAGRSTVRWPAPAVAAVTFAVGIALVAIGFTRLWSGGFVGAGSPDSDWWFLLPLAVACVAMLIKRRTPRLALGIATAALLADLYLGSSLGTLLAFYDVLYAVALTASPRLRRVLVLAAAVAVGGPAVAVLAAGADLRIALFVGVQLFALLATPLWWASDVRRRDELLDLAAQRTADLGRIHDLSRERAVGEERTAMARDLHDVVASHMSAIALRSGAALATPPDSARDRAALEAIRESALAAHADMRSMITLLRDSAPSSPPGSPVPDPAPGSATLADLPALLRRADAMGVAVRLRDDRATGTAVPPAIEHAAFRIAQEAVMNAVQHAPGGEVEVRLAAGDDGGLHLRVRSTRTRRATEPVSSGGVGLLTMAERARAVGGELTVESTDNEWVVEARLPAVAS
ncbi:histidine kinase [Conyzicola nivalis]|uniref:histidine kinase n=1 Tax=Conyzicola nivalis TaxID=1477021 RepID=A0A916WEW1_9MICO|nr:histidine kinase [Conyzicola nivalis]GGA91329.1 two-component sensor histidine kinase [Conyzicola nivalis]